MTNKLIPIIIAVAVIVGGAFYSGMKYGQGKAQRGLSQADFQNLRNLSPEERQQRLQQMGMAGAGFQNRGFDSRTGEGFVSGEIIFKDQKSITVKLRDGGSKIVFYSDATEVGMLVNGALSDLEVGKQVIVNGKANQDNSITAQSIQTRP